MRPVEIPTKSQNISILLVSADHRNGFDKAVRTASRFVEKAECGASILQSTNRLPGCRVLVSERKMNYKFLHMNLVIVFDDAKDVNLFEEIVRNASFFIEFGQTATKQLQV